jgi:DNA repair protein SbcC/Rad50
VVAALDASPAALTSLVGDAGVEALGRLRAVREDGMRDAAALDRVVGVEAALNDRRREVRDARDLVETLRLELAADDAWLQARPALRTALAAHLAAAGAVIARAGEHERRLQDLTALASAHVELAALLDEVSRADVVRAESASAASAAVSHEASLRTARIAGLAGELAAPLADGDACPVCGSDDHPAKAALAPDHVSPADVLAAERARGRAEAAFARARDAWVRLSERAEAGRSALGGSTPEQVAADLAVTRALLGECVAAQRESTRLTAEIAALEVATSERQEARQDTAARLADVLGRIDVMQQALDADEAEVASACADHPTVVARQSALLTLVEAAAELIAAITDSEAAELAEAERRTELDAALAERDFADAGEAQAALLGRADLANLESSLTAYSAAVERVRAGLAEDELSGLATDASVDLPAATEAERSARAAATAAEGRARVADERARAASAAADGVLATVGRLDAAWAAGAPIARLAGLAAGTGGDNGKSLSLATYVLARRFEDVVAAANERLLSMSDGRYELTRSDQKEDVSSRRTGLSMRVIDHRTQQQRDPRTLSGGESFYVSLCLALGMADVVTGEAGGIDLGTLFVDEGFGTLDGHTLDQVLAELGKLRAGGRVVGVVSHVDALKQSIADRIEVRPLPSGPSTLRVLAS